MNEQNILETQLFRCQRAERKNRPHAINRLA